MKVLCVTWNLELQCPDDAALKKSFVDVVTREQPDVIVIGLQEAASYSRTKHVMVGHRLVRSGKLLAGGTFARDPYVSITESAFKGMTKVGQLFGKKAQQSIQVLARSSVAGEQFSRRKRVIGSGSRKNVKSKTKAKSLPSEKGFVFADLTLNGVHLGFISTHLDAGSATKRTKGCKDIAKHLIKARDEAGMFHALFMMGDLNFRLSREDAGMMKGKRSWKTLKLVKKQKRVATAVSGTETDRVLGALLSRAGRSHLIQAQDTFGGADAVKAFNELPFVWPEFGDDCLPSYKRTKKKNQFNLIRSLEGKIDAETGDIDQRHYHLLKSIFAAEGGKLRSKRVGEYDFGWLDRIGVAVQQNLFINPGYKGRKLLVGGYPLDDATPILNETWSHVPFGDHAPIYCLFTFKRA